MFASDAELKKRRDAAAAAQQRPGFKIPILHDPIEDDPATGPVIRSAQSKADAEIDAKIRMGRCQAVWKRTKKILKEEHGIAWFSPADMNPQFRFD